MITEATKEKIFELENNAEFMNDFVLTSTPDEAISLFGRYGVNITLDELSEFVQHSMPSTDGEISINEAANVVGGSGLRTLKIISKLIKIIPPVVGGPVRSRW